jgi:hypothetical protein
VEQDNSLVIASGVFLSPFAAAAVRVLQLASPQQFQLIPAGRNGALKAAVERIVVNPEDASLAVHWGDSDATSEVPFWSRHDTGFDEPTDDERTATDAD